MSRASSETQPRDDQQGQSDGYPFDKARHASPLADFLPQGFPPRAALRSRFGGERGANKDQPGAGSAWLERDRRRAAHGLGIPPRLPRKHQPRLTGAERGQGFSRRLGFGLNAELGTKSARRSDENRSAAEGCRLCRAACRTHLRRLGLHLGQHEVRRRRRRGRLRFCCPAGRARRNRPHRLLPEVELPPHEADAMAPCGGRRRQRRRLSDPSQRRRGRFGGKPGSHALRNGAGRLGLPGLNAAPAGGRRKLEPNPARKLKTGSRGVRRRPGQLPQRRRARLKPRLRPAHFENRPEPNHPAWPGRLARRLRGSHGGRRR